MSILYYTRTRLASNMYPNEAPGVIQRHGWGSLEGGPNFVGGRRAARGVPLKVDRVTLFASQVSRTRPTGWGDSPGWDPDEVVP